MSLAAVISSCDGSKRNAGINLSVQNDCVDAELSCDSNLYMNSTWDYYPASASKVSVTLHSESVSVLAGDGHVFTIVDDSTQKTIGNRLEAVYSKITNGDRGYERCVELRLNEKLESGKYGVKLTYNDCDTLTSGFQVVNSKEVMAVKDKISDYFSSKNGLRNDTVACNVYSYGIVSGDSIEVDLRHDSPRMRDLFCREVVSYSALKFTGQVQPCVYGGPVVSDTLGISMTTLDEIYPDTVGEIRFVLHNNSRKTLCYGTPYKVARNVDGKWMELYQGGVWNMPLFLIAPGGCSEVMTAKLFRPINDIGPGEYIIYKDVYFDGGKEDRWNICARFSIK